MTTETATYEILMAIGNADSPLFGTRSGDWESLPDANSSASEAEAEAMIAELRQIPDEGWNDGAYAVRRVGDQYPL